MATSRRGSRRNARLDSFLKRNTERAVYEGIGACEPCVVVSESVDKVYMHAVLADERVYLTEYPPRTLATAFSFGRVRDIELVKDFPNFLSGKDRELCQHIRITYVTDKPASRGRQWLRTDGRSGFRRAGLSSRRVSHCPGTHAFHGYPEDRTPGEGLLLPAPTRSASCPDPESLGLPRAPRPPAQPSSPLPFLTRSTTFPLRAFSGRPSGADEGQVQRRVASVLSRLLLLRRDCVGGAEEREAQLHLYAVSPESRLYLHLQSAWNSCIIRSTLMLDPLYRGRCTGPPDSSPRKRGPSISWERTAHRFAQLSAELLQEQISVEGVYLLLQELRTAAHRQVALCRLFWRSGELCVFLVQTLEESLHGCQGLARVHTQDQLLLSTLAAQTLAVMFREAGAEAAKLDVLTAEKGALASRMLLALVCDPQLQGRCGDSLADQELQALLSQYLDAACSLLFELLLLGHEASRCSSADNFLSVGWILRVLQRHPHTMTFIGHQAQQVVLVLSDRQGSFLSPAQSVLLFQRCRLLLACLQHSNQLAQHLHCSFREEFRYFVKLPVAEAKLPPHYPISQPTLRLVQQILMLHR